MSASVFSASWYRVADLIPRLRSHAEIHRVSFRGQRWYLLQDHSSGRFHRFSPAAHTLIGLMNGRRTVAEIWNLASDRLGDDLPSQEETIRLLAQLYRANALASDAAADVRELVERDRNVRRTAFLANYRSPLAIKIPLWDPDRFLERTKSVAWSLYSRTGVFVWLVVVGLATVLAAEHWTTLSTGLGDRVLAAENFVLLWLSFPVVKLIHEFGHAYAVKRFGGEVHELGVMFLVGVPVPYVDATSSTAFASRWQRALVGAAGVFVELFVAALAMFLWVSVEPGALRAISFNVMLIAGLSSLFFNGNPFLRFDAYYVLSDLIEVPNLAARANQYWGYRIQRDLFGLRSAENPATSRGEAPWLFLYAAGALFNRMLITLSIALFVASEFFFVGVMIAAWSITQFAFLPIFRHLRFVFFDSRLRGQRGRALAWTLGALGFLVIVLGWLPAPSWTSAAGVVWASEDAWVRAGTEGVVEAFRAEPGSRVVPGQALVELGDPELLSEYEVAEANVRAAQAQYALDRTLDRVQAVISRESLEHAERRLARVQDELAALEVSSPGEGLFLVEAPQDWIGRFLRRGETIGYVMDAAPLIVRVVVSPDQIDLVRNRTSKIEVRLAERLDSVYLAAIVAEVPAATDVLPSMALAVEGGGRIALDPQQAGEVRAFERYFLFDLGVDLGNDSEQAPIRVGGRVHVRFDHPPEPLFAQFYRMARRIFLSQFNV